MSDAILIDVVDFLRHELESSCQVNSLVRAVSTEIKCQSEITTYLNILVTLALACSKMWLEKLSFLRTFPDLHFMLTFEED